MVGQPLETIRPEAVLRREKSPLSELSKLAVGSFVYSSLVSYTYSGIDLREHPDAYEIGRGEQGVFHAEPYKSELLPLWSFKDARAAKKSANDIYARFLQYRAEGDFVGMDVARKYLQMGYTRSRRYAKYEGGNKSKPLENPNPQKSRAAEVFYKMPLIAWSWPTATQLVGERLDELQAPLADGFVGHLHTSLGHQLLDVAVAQGESVVQPDAVADDLARKTVVLHIPDSPHASSS
jgi:hypothetical protein